MVARDVLAFFLLPSIGFASGEVHQFDVSKFSELDVSHTEGAVSIQVSKSAKGAVNVTNKKFARGCDPRIETAGKTLVVKTKGDFGNQCPADFVIEVPASTAVRVKIGSGDLKIADLSGSIDFKIGSGTAKVFGATRKLTGKTGSGDITAADLVAQVVELSTGSGDLDLSYGQVAKGSRLDIRTGRGSASVTLPANAKVGANLRAGAGSLSSDFVNSSDADLRVDMRAGSGDLKLKKFELSKK